MSMSDKIHHPASRLFFWFCYASVCLWLALASSWWLFAQFDYGYRHWYGALQIEQHLDQYASQNVRRPGFNQLPPEQHWQAFAQISRAVHDGGIGLEEIDYPLPGGARLPLLVDDEVAHLRDVATLIDLGAKISLLMLLAWPLFGWLLVAGRVPRLRARLVAAAVPLTAVALWLLLAGPTAVFYRLHEWLFPPENPWFFYWEESLMSALMKAPVLFGAIAVVLALGTLILTPVFYFAGLVLAGYGRRFLSRPAGTAP